jgi:cytochrome c oxidase subunit II
MARAFRRLLLFFTPLTLLLAGCTVAGNSAVFLPAGPASRSISDLFWIITAISAVFFLVVEVGLWTALIRFRKRRVEGEPPQVYNSFPLEILWTAVPIVAISVAAYFNLTTASANRPDLAGWGDPGNVRIQVYGHQWWWEVRYPDQKIVTATEIYVPVGTRVDIQLYSDNVLHSFGVPELTPGKTQVIPGQTNQTWLQADRPGTFNGYCYEFCGEQHVAMRFWVHAVSAQQFDNWVKSQQPLPVVDQANWEYFSARWCPACHTIDGTPAKGLIGPNLSHVASRHQLAGGAFTNTPDNMRAWLKDPQAVKHGNFMPNLELGDDRINQLVTFMEGLK